MAARSKDWVYGHSLDGNAGSNLAGAWTSALAGVVCYRADHNSGGVLPGMVCLGMIVKPR